ncbi:MAG: RNA methyltransferase [Alphaproteobacteria bacterium]|nr:RNA methyltransferase [Alphaproteobacteria bacterium]
MSVKSITSTANPQIKQIASLFVRKYRTQAKQFVAEGIRTLLDAQEQGFVPRTLVYLDDMGGNKHVERLRGAMGTKGSCLEVSRKVMEKLTGRGNPQSVIGIFDQHQGDLAGIAAHKAGIWVALEGVRDPGNLGTVIRTADSAGADGVILIGEVCDPFSIEVVRASMGSIFNQKLIRCSCDEFLVWRSKWPGMVVGTHLQAKQGYRAPKYRKPILLLIGNEQSGLPENMAKACDTLVKIPMRGRADSLNLAVATGVMLYAITDACG